MTAMDMRCSVIAAQQWQTAYEPLQKAIGAALVILSCILIGCRQKNGQLSRLEQLVELKRIFVYIQNQMQFSGRSMDEIIAECGMQSEVFRPWFEEIVRQMSGFSESTFGRIWEESIRRTGGSLGMLRYEDMELVRRFGTYLSCTDRKMQQDMLGMVVQQMEQHIVRQEAKVRSNAKVYQCLAVFAGLLITIVLI